MVDAPQRGIISYYESSLDLKNKDLWNSDPSAFDAAYQALVYRYSRREFTHEKDYFAAFQGIVASFERASRIEFAWGLPKAYFGVALTWAMDHSSGKVTRRLQKCSRVTSEGILEVEYPSWSWMGWIGPSLFEDLFGKLTREHAGLEFFVFNDDGGSLIHVDQSRNFTPSRRSQGKQHARAAPRWRGDTMREVRREDISKSLLRPEIYPRLLAFWTSCAKNELQCRVAARSSRQISSNPLRRRPKRSDCLVGSVSRFSHTRRAYFHVLDCWTR